MSFHVMKEIDCKKYKERKSVKKCREKNEVIREYHEKLLSAADTLNLLLDEKRALVEKINRALAAGTVPSKFDVQSKKEIDQKILLQESDIRLLENERRIRLLEVERDIKSGELIKDVRAKIESWGKSMDDALAVADALNEIFDQIDGSIQNLSPLPEEHDDVLRTLADDPDIIIPPEMKERLKKTGEFDEEIF